jgi:hypothetical protein
MVQSASTAKAEGRRMMPEYWKKYQFSSSGNKESASYMNKELLIDGIKECKATFDRM